MLRAALPAQDGALKGVAFVEFCTRKEAVRARLALDQFCCEHTHTPHFTNINNHMAKYKTEY